MTHAVPQSIVFGNGKTHIAKTTPQTGKHKIPKFTGLRPIKKHDRTTGKNFGHRKPAVSIPKKCGTKAMIGLSPFSCSSFCTTMNRRKSSGDAVNAHKPSIKLLPKQRKCARNSSSLLFPTSGEMRPTNCARQCCIFCESKSAPHNLNRPPKHVASEKVKPPVAPAKTEKNNASD